jgi:hypothetical protein
MEGNVTEDEDSLDLGRGISAEPLLELRDETALDSYLSVLD